MASSFGIEGDDDEYAHEEVAVSERMIEWFSLEQEPSIWVAFVLAMALLALIMRKG